MFALPGDEYVYDDEVIGEGLQGKVHTQVAMYQHIRRSIIAPRAGATWALWGSNTVQKDDALGDDHMDQMIKVTLWGIIHKSDSAIWK